MPGATPAPDIFANNPTRHAELDRLVDQNMFIICPGGLQDHGAYIHLLTLIVQYSDNQLDNTYSQVVPAFKKLNEDSSLRDQLRDAWESRSYRTIRNLGKC